MSRTVHETRPYTGMIAETVTDKRRKEPLTVFRPSDYPFTELGLSENGYSLKFPSFHDKTFIPLLMLAAGIELGAYSYGIANSNSGKSTMVPMQEGADANRIDYKRMRSPLAHANLLGGVALSDFTELGFSCRKPDIHYKEWPPHPELWALWAQAWDPEYPHDYFSLRNTHYADMSDDRVQSFLRSAMVSLRDYDKTRAIFCLTIMQLYGEGQYEEQLQNEEGLQALARE